MTSGIHWGIRSILGTKGLPCLAFYIVNNELRLKCFSKFFCDKLYRRFQALISTEICTWTGW